MEILQFLGRFLNTLFPEKCVICKKGLNAICDDCKEKIIPITWQCLKCGYPSKKNHVPFCENCLLEEVVPDLIISLFTYEKISPVIINLKEKGSLKAKKALKELLEKYLPKKLEIMDYLSPAETVLTRVPNHPLKVLKRGNDHTLEIAKMISKLTGYRFVDGIITKEKLTPSQKGLTREERIKSIKDSFSCKTKIPFKNLIIVDDVITTMATVNEVSKKVKNLNPHVRIIAITIARATVK